MKTLRIAALGALAMAFIGTASAQTAIKITGSTAFRTGAVAAIINSLNSPTAAFVGAGPINKATQAIITGALKSNGHTVYYQLAWTGSISGVQATANGLTTLPLSGLAPGATWVSLTQTNPSNATFTAVTATRASNQSYSFSGGTALTTTGGAINFDTATAPDVVFSDTSLGSIYASGLTSGPALNGVSPSSVSTSDGVVGVIPFVWVKGPAMTGLTGTAATNYAAGYARLTNITAQNVQALYANGIIPLSAITGNLTDQTVDVILVGRNNDSGTRFGSISETTFSTAATGNPYPFLFDLSANTHDGSAIVDVSSPYDNGGFSSGGNLATAVNLFPTSAAVAGEPNGLPFILVTYLGVSDAFTVVNPASGKGNGALLSYDGIIAPIVNPTGGPGGVPVVDLLNPATNLGQLIQQGAYSFWEQEHVYFRSGLSSTTSGDLVQATNDAFVQVFNTDAIAAGLTTAYLNAAPSYFGGTSRNDEFSTVLP